MIKSTEKGYAKLVILHQEDIDGALVIGKGNMSLGLRTAIRRCIARMKPTTKEMEVKK